MPAKDEFTIVGAARELGIAPSTIHRWINNFAKGKTPALEKTAAGMVRLRDVKRCMRVPKTGRRHGIYENGSPFPSDGAAERWIKKRGPFEADADFIVEQRPIVAAQASANAAPFLDGINGLKRAASAFQVMINYHVGAGRKAKLYELFMGAISYMDVAENWQKKWNQYHAARKEHRLAIVREDQRRRGLGLKSRAAESIERDAESRAYFQALEAKFKDLDEARDAALAARKDEQAAERVARKANQAKAAAEWQAKLKKQAAQRERSKGLA